MAASIPTAQDKVQRAFASALRHTESTGTLLEVESALWASLLELGRAMMELFLLRTAQRPRSAKYRHEGQEFVLDRRSRRSGVIGGRFGKVSFIRPVGRRIGGRVGSKVDLPVDRELGLCGGFSLGTVASVVKLTAMMAFAQARSTFRDFHDWAPSQRATLRMVDAIGAEARSFLDQAPPPDDDGEILVVQVDGRGAPMITQTERARRRQPHTQRIGTQRAHRRDRRREHPRPRRQKGDKSKNAKVAVLAVIYTMRKTTHGLEGPINKRVIGTFGSHAELMAWARAQADKRGYGRKKCLFLADGSEHIWREQAKHFPEAEGCLDWYHVVEKLWEVGHMFHKEGSKALSSWVSERRDMLRGGKIWPLIDQLVALRSRVPKARAKRLSDIITHFGEHAERMNYQSLRRRGLDIATGAVEGAVRNVVAVRLDGPGMRWGRERSELILHLRCILLNGQWGDFVTHLAQRGSVTLPAQPLPATPHAAAA